MVEEGSMGWGDELVKSSGGGGESNRTIFTPGTSVEKDLEEENGK